MCHLSAVNKDGGILLFGLIDEFFRLNKVSVYPFV